MEFLSRKSSVVIVVSPLPPPPSIVAVAQPMFGSLYHGTVLDCRSFAQQYSGMGFLLNVQLFALIAPLSTTYRLEEWLLNQVAGASFIATVVELGGGNVRLHTVQLLQRCLLDVDAVCGHPDSLLWGETI